MVINNAIIIKRAVGKILAFIVKNDNLKNMLISQKPSNQY